MDCVVVFDEARVTQLITSVKPHVYAKGGDYTIESLDPGEREALEKIGATIKILPLVPGQGEVTLLDNSPLNLRILAFTMSVSLFSRSTVPPSRFR